ncbi:MAG TPA: 16S rRNA (cytosine(967)-C(5))-methyltransferase RsmB [Verrucomicrobiae bacterium]|nr:16S rRNA (cytosine(967)-C(5))-methyltransferase RsmB [Verrucomicrobiae bacterium]
MNARDVALALLDRWQRTRRLADELLEEQLNRENLSSADRALTTELFYGCLRQKRALEFFIGLYAAKTPRPLVANILKLGLYQLAVMHTPPHAAVNEAVDLATRRASAAEARFVNAVLRKAAAADLGAALEKAESWIRVSHPRWLWERWRERWGERDATGLCEWNNRPPPVYLRVNSLKTTTKPGEVDAEPTSHPLCWRVLDPAGLFATQAWANGEFYVQDPSTLIAVDVLDPQPGQSVLDLCAAPGGKTTYIAQKMQNRGKIIASDSSRARLGLVTENCERLGVAIVTTFVGDGTRLDRCLRDERFDRVLVDAPCSNTGVMRRRPDLRWRIEEKEITRLARLQLKLLERAAEFARPGGVLAYSTCSLEPEENERVVEQFLGSHAEVRLETTRSLFPPRDGCDGAFVARLVKH